MRLLHVFELIVVIGTNNIETKRKYFTVITNYVFRQECCPVFGETKYELAAFDIRPCLLR